VVPCGGRQFRQLHAQDVGCQSHLSPAPSLFFGTGQVVAPDRIFVARSRPKKNPMAIRHGVLP
jgi:hypothetical protein